MWQPDVYPAARSEKDGDEWLFVPLFMPRLTNYRIRVMSPSRQRMLDDMRMRKLTEKTQSHYIRAVRQLTVFLERSPDTATIEDLRRHQLHLVDHGTSPVSLNAAISGLKFFFEVTLDRAELMAKMQSVRVPRTLPVVLSRDEAARLVTAASNLKHQAALLLMESQD